MPQTIPTDVTRLDTAGPPGVHFVAVAACTPTSCAELRCAGHRSLAAYQVECVQPPDRHLGRWLRGQRARRSRLGHLVI
jgi:hypothetical protein